MTMKGFNKSNFYAIVLLQLTSISTIHDVKSWISREIRNY